MKLACLLFTLQTSTFRETAELPLLGHLKLFARRARILCRHHRAGQVPG
ncbi:hypothetical protein PFLCHA0_c50920 [Pseudomonas protegens CHA0]|uniref:Uncharacterized protein n=1 Tax=Pseudomonas protegens (strain DSM 19095 / LMG 27888 / CFBP 6595 / CHA0) TaxID=1124983 RepID=A0A2C9ETB6_PSEPH|nr:hypothetical protein PFLCHA0_c50920 [Pseudomonas protegens CHA0]